uniref:Uncharacterized protein n=1 Tax=Mustela putorius furo TaxID=9669 RepID=M3Y6C6_MUSPF
SSLVLRKKKKISVNEPLRRQCHNEPREVGREERRKRRQRRKKRRKEGRQARKKERKKERERKEKRKGKESKAWPRSFSSVGPRWQGEGESLKK